MLAAERARPSTSFAPHQVWLDYAIAIRASSVWKASRSVAEKQSRSCSCADRTAAAQEASSLRPAGVIFTEYARASRRVRRRCSESALHETPDQLGRARPVNARCLHDVGLTEAIIARHGLKNRELTRRNISIRHMLHEQCVCTLTGAM